MNLEKNIVEMKHSQLQQVHALYNYNRNQRKAILAEKKAAQRDHIIYILIIGSMVLGMFAAFIYRKKMVLKKKRIAATQLLYEDSLLKLKKLQAELLQLQEEQDNKMSLMIREKEEAIGVCKQKITLQTDNNCIRIVCNVNTKEWNNGFNYYTEG